MRKEYGGMGFRHLHGFNLAMLGKQGWKLLTNHDAIISRVFKAKYYPHSGFLEARLGHNPSYVWRSIYSSRLVVRQGARWRIGNGNSVNVWNQPWLRDKTNAYVNTQPPVGWENVKVADLVSREHGGWNVSLVNQIFQPRDVNEILKIPIAYTSAHDRLMWRLSCNGNFSVRSAYHHLMECVIDNTHLREPGEWKALWKLKVPNHVKVFMWRVARGVLPIRQRLIRRGVECDGDCPHCHQLPENEWHLFFGCDQARDVWVEMGLWSIMEQHVNKAEGFNELLCTILTQFAVEQRALIAMGLWSIWWRRNSLVWENTTRTKLETAGRAVHQLQDWLQAHKKTCNSSNIQYVEAITRWKKPDPGTLKCNIDAAMFSDSNCFGIGICIRDDIGAFVKARTAQFHGTPLVHEVEAYGLLEALSWLKEMNVKNIIIELDSLMVVEAMRGLRSNNTEFGCIIHKCTSFINPLDNFRISFIRRQDNRVTHALASVSRFFASHQVFEFMLPCTEELIFSEMI